jgi:hypothetical protein
VSLRRLARPLDPGMGLAGRSAPLYWRMLRLRRLRPAPAATFLLFEGSILLGVLLALAEIISWWGAPVIPLAVAVMVKLNDMVASTLDLRPLAEAQLRTPRPRDWRPIGMSRVSSAGRLTTRIEADDAVADPTARPQPAPAPGVARGVASVPRRPAPRPALDDPLAPECPAEALAEAAEPSIEQLLRRSNQGRFTQ